MPKTVVAAYIPVLHNGYLSFFANHPADVIYLFDDVLLKETDYIRKDLRAVKPSVMAPLIEAATKIPTKVITRSELKGMTGCQWLLPDEDVSHDIAQKYLKDEDISYVPVFLRWDRRNVEGVDLVSDSATVSNSELDKERMTVAYQQAQRSPDIWRNVGAALYSKDGKLLDAAGNLPALSQHTPTADGDPRNVFNRGVGIEMSTFMHAEAKIIAQAAKTGLTLKGTTLYVTTFPCPACAMLVAYSGIKTCYYTEGYAILDGERVMTQNGVKLVKVDIAPPEPNPERLVVYPSK